MPSNKQRRDAERRRLQRQALRRRERAAHNRRITLIVSIVGAVVLIGLVVGIIVATSGGDTPAAGPGGTTPANHPGTTSHQSTPAGPTSPGSSTGSTSPAGTSTCTFTPSGTAARKVTLPPANPPTKGTATATVETNRGTMTFTLDRKAAPCASASFVSLAQQGYFDKTTCHRLTTGGLYVLQCGDPTATGSGGPGYKFPDELTGKEKYTKGVLAMANAGPDTNGSQFFIVYKDSQLPASYTIFGSVSKGLGVVTKIAAKGVKGGGTDGAPAESVQLTKVTVAK